MAATLDYEEFDICLKQLARINRLTFAYPPTLRWLKKHLKPHTATVTILDIGSGGGDMLRVIEKWTERRGISVELIGVDLNPWSKRSAEALAFPGSNIKHETSDIFAFDQSRRADYIISSLFTHHLSDEALVRFLSWMENHATKGWLVNDLHRHPVPYSFRETCFQLAASQPAGET